ncbi:hypothetical protein GCM10027595_16120 [Corynebacterium nasicanis]
MTPTSTAVTSTVEAPTPDSPAGPDASVVENILQTTWASLGDPGAELDLSPVLTGTALEDVQNQRQEWIINEWHQEGMARIVSTEIEHTADPAVVLARVCVDSAGVEVKDENGATVNSDIPPEEQRSLMLATFSLVEGRWKLAERQFPDDPRC